MSKVEILVKIEDALADKMSGIAKECRAVGMRVDQQMSAVGMISGAIEEAKISQIERIEGVSYVEKSTPLSNA